LLIELGDYWIETSHVIAVKSASKTKTSVWCIGQNAESGAFLIDEPIDDVIERLHTIQNHAFAEQLLDELEAERVAGVESAENS
jgi:hypothetical protein